MKKQQGKKFKIWFALMIYLLAVAGGFNKAAAIRCFTMDGNAELEAENNICCQTSPVSLESVSKYSEQLVSSFPSVEDHCDPCMDTPPSISSTEYYPIETHFTSLKHLATLEVLPSTPSTGPEIVNRVVYQVLPVEANTPLVSLHSVVLLC